MQLIYIAEDLCKRLMFLKLEILHNLSQSMIINAWNIKAALIPSFLPTHTTSNAVLYTFLIAKKQNEIPR